MTTIDLPEPDLRAISLVPYKRVVLGGAEEAQQEPGRLALGLPVLTPLTVEAVDEDARVFLRSRAGSRFALLTLTASFVHDEGKPFESGWVDVAVSCSGDPDAEPPVAWSMQPRSEADPSTVLRKVSVDGSLKLSVPGGLVEAGPGAAGERSTTFGRPMIKLEALNEGTSTPRWVFYRTETTAIRGIHRLCMVIDIPATAPGLAKISLGATIQMRRMRILRYDAALPPEIALVRLPVG